MKMHRQHYIPKDSTPAITLQYFFALYLFNKGNTADDDVQQDEDILKAVKNLNNVSYGTDDGRCERTGHSYVLFQWEWNQARLDGGVCDGFIDGGLSDIALIQSDCILYFILLS